MTRPDEDSVREDGHAAMAATIRARSDAAIRCSLRLLRAPAYPGDFVAPPPRPAAAGLAE